MIGIVNLNPCVDKTWFFDQIPSEGIHTVRRVRTLPGGKGNNVSRVLSTFGVPHRSFVLFAGIAGSYIESMMKSGGLPYDGFWIEGENRTIITLADEQNRQIALKETGPEVAPTEAERLRTAFLAFLDYVDILCLTGTMPCASLSDFPLFAIEEAHVRGVRVLLDTSGPSLRTGLLAKPDIVKPNLEELSEIWPTPLISSAQRIRALHSLMESGIPLPILSMGAAGAYAGWEGGAYRVLPPSVRAVNPVASGDSFISGLLYGLHRQLPVLECLRWGAASGAANAAVWDPAVLTREQVEALLPDARIRKMG